jgi:hypothetical protein
VTNVQITIRFRRETRDDFGVFPDAQIFRNNVANKIRRPFCFSAHRNGQTLSANAQIDNFGKRALEYFADIPSGAKRSQRIPRLYETQMPRDPRLR